MKEDSFKGNFTVLGVTKTADSRMDYIIFEVMEVTEWLKMR